MLNKPDVWELVMVGNDDGGVKLMGTQGASRWRLNTASRLFEKVVGNIFKKSNTV